MKHNYLKPVNTSFNPQAIIALILCCLIVLSVQSIAEARIVYDYNGSIYVMNDDGGGIRRLTDNQFWELSAHWSPDGTQIAFERNLEKDIQKYQLFIMNADGTDQQQLTHHGDGDRNGDPTWSPDGRYLAFKSNRNKLSQIFVMELESRTVKQLTGVEEDSNSTSPDWSPDGKEIIYQKPVSRGGGLSHNNIWKMSADGTNQRPLLPDPAPEDPFTFRAFPDWSPDGQRILFLESKGKLDDPVKRFVIMRRSGAKTVVDITEKMGGDWVGSGLCWTDHGRAFLFSAGLLDVPEDKRYHDIYRYEIATGKLRRLTRHRYHDMEPDWVAGPLHVFRQDKLPTQWGDMKAEYDIETSSESE